MLLLLSACAGEVVGPSLAKRPIESRSMAEPVREIARPAPADATLTGRIAGLVERARAGQRDFAALRTRAEAAAAAAGPQGSESWIAAQQLLSALEGARGPTTAALAELDRMILDGLAGGNEAGTVELQQANAEVAALVTAQQRDFDSLRNRIVR